MLLKRLIASCLLLCFALLIGHDIIPHEHFEKAELEDHFNHDHDHNHDHDSDHHDEDAEEENLNLFSFIPHSDIYLPAHVSKFTYYKIVVTGLCMESISLHNPDKDIPPKIPDSLSYYDTNFNSSCSSLRAPPIPFALI
jgi:hypothetical protein